MREVFPGAPHRFCVMHLWRNFSKQWKDKELRGLVWQCARTTTKPKFEKGMEAIKRKNDNSFKYLDKWPKESWTKAYFSENSKVDIITNNNCESFNAKILKYRSNPILTLLEEIRCYIMRKMSSTN